LDRVIIYWPASSLGTFAMLNSFISNDIRRLSLSLK
jgi:hypothetical protein